MKNNRSVPRQAGTKGTTLSASAGRAFDLKRDASPYCTASFFVAVLLSGALAACGGGGTDQVDPTASVSGVNDAVAHQAQSAAALLTFRAALVASPTYPIRIEYDTSPGNPGATVGSSCSDGIDYVIPPADGLTVRIRPDNTATGQLTITSAAASRQINVTACPGASDRNEVFNLNWNDGVASGTATGVILGSANTSLAGTMTLNDTGITTCATDAATGACPQAGFAGQDAETGRDADVAITGAGTNKTSAFLFTRLPAGECYQDSTTGLVWEGKTASGLHSSSATYSWFSSDGTSNGGATGTAAGGTCTGVTGGCDTEKFVAAVNATALCGFTDWRLPTPEELSGIVDNGAATAPTVDPSLPNQAAAQYWTASPMAPSTGPDDVAANAWFVDFLSGAVGFENKAQALRVRLVRGR